ncbi:MAG TPA: heavy metal translocating P-type ATPase [Gemmatimonadales bacterium]|nr:heavy metal translocating P-type ATPase [Gemmatimonadales bacterium]
MGRLVWTAGLVLTGVPVVWRTLRGLASGRLAADLVATLAIVAAVPLAQPLAGLIVVLMQTGGEALERYAEGRASEAVRALEAAAPRTAQRLGSGGSEEIPVDAVVIGDELLIRPGEMVPCDGMVQTGRSHVDVSRLTGEPVPVSAAPGVGLRSGSLNLESPLTLRVSAPARESQYARIVELVRSAQASKSPIQRLADRYAVWFTPLTLAICGLAWAGSGEAVRALAVLVVATPCPLIIATPVAIIGGINRAARRGIVFRHGTALEQLGGVRTALFDKTGTLTIGRPEVSRLIVAEPLDEAGLLRLMAGVEHGSGHLLGRMVVEAAAARGIRPPEAREVVEAPGQGLTGFVEGRRVTIGAWSYVVGREPAAEEGLRALLAGEPAAALRAVVAVDGEAAGAVEFADRVRPGLAELFHRLRGLGIQRTLLLSGDSQANAAAIGAEVGIDEAEGDLLPEAKVAVVHRLVKAGEQVVMVGDGTNDAPALSTATVGIALASGGGGITAEAADAVILADDPGRLADAIAISRRTLRLARESIWVGLGLSGAAMIAAALGRIPPTVGALLQEAIDVAVILNALRAAGPGRSSR